MNYILKTTCFLIQLLNNILLLHRRATSGADSKEVRKYTNQKFYIKLVSLKGPREEITTHSFNSRLITNVSHKKKKKRNVPQCGGYHFFRVSGFPVEFIMTPLLPEISENCKYLLTKFFILFAFTSLDIQRLLVLAFLNLIFPLMSSTGERGDGFFTKKA